MASLPAPVLALAAGTGSQLERPLPPGLGTPAEAGADSHGSFSAALTWAGGSVALRDLANGVALSRSLLRRIVLRLRGCLGALDAEQARVLALRTGIGLRRGFRQGVVARVLRITRAREAWLEDSAVLALAAAASDGLCAGGVSGRSVAFPGLSWPSQLLAATAPGAASSRTPAGRAQTVADQSKRSDPASATSSSSGGVDWFTFAVMLAALTVAGLAGWRLLWEGR